MITRGFLCLFKQVPYLCALSTTAVQLSAVGTRALFFVFPIINRTSRDKKFVFFGSFSSSLVYDRCIASAFEAHACDVVQSRCVCFISREHSCVINNRVIHCYCSLEAVTD